MSYPYYCNWWPLLMTWLISPIDTGNMWRHFLYCYNDRMKGAAFLMIYINIGKVEPANTQDQLLEGLNVIMIVWVSNKRFNENWLFEFFLKQVAENEKLFRYNYIRHIAILSTYLRILHKNEVFPSKLSKRSITTLPLMASKFIAHPLKSKFIFPLALSKIIKTRKILANGWRY